LDGVGILTKAPGERRERRQPGGLRRLQPWLKRWQISLGEEGLNAGLERVALGWEGINP